MQCSHIAYICLIHSVNGILLVRSWWCVVNESCFTCFWWKWVSCQDRPRSFEKILCVKMSNLFDVISFSKKIKRENFGQNKDNLINYLNKDYGYSRESAIEVVQKAVTEICWILYCLTGKIHIESLTMLAIQFLCPTHSKTNQNRLRPYLSWMSQILRRL